MAGPADLGLGREKRQPSAGASVPTDGNHTPSLQSRERGVACLRGWLLGTRDGLRLGGRQGGPGRTDGANWRRGVMPRARASTSASCLTVAGVAEGSSPAEPDRRRWCNNNMKVGLVISLLLIAATACDSSTAVTKIPSGGIVVLPCQNVILSTPAPSSDLSIILDRVALPTINALQANGSGDSDPSTRLFTKSLIMIRRDASFDVVVPDEWRGRLIIGWARQGRRSTQVRVPGCRPTHTLEPVRETGDDWLGYAFGFWVSEPACVSLVVRAGQAESAVRIGLGASCPGQGPPPSPV
jgi:hypothetical protein